MLALHGHRRRAHHLHLRRLDRHVLGAGAGDRLPGLLDVQTAGLVAVLGQHHLHALLLLLHLLLCLLEGDVLDGGLGLLHGLGLGSDGGLGTFHQEEGPILPNDGLAQRPIDVDQHGGPRGRLVGRGDLLLHDLLHGLERLLLLGLLLQVHHLLLLLLLQRLGLLHNVLWLRAHRGDLHDLLPGLRSLHPHLLLGAASGGQQLWLLLDQAHTTGGAEYLLRRLLGGLQVHDASVALLHELSTAKAHLGHLIRYGRVDHGLLLLDKGDCSLCDWLKPLLDSAGRSWFLR